MAATAVSLTVVALAFAGRSDCARPVWTGQPEGPPQPVVVYAARAANHRVAKELMQDRNGPQRLETTDEHKTTGHKSSADGYRTLSSSAPEDPAVAVDPQQADVNAGVYPVLATDPLPLSFGTRNRYVRRPFYSGGGGGRDFGQDAEIVNDQRPEYSAGNANVAPKWNRYYPAGHRQLKKYGPMIVQETDVSQTDGGNLVNLGGGFNGYDNSVDYNTNSAAYELDGLKAQSGGSEVGWYGDPHQQAMPPKPAAIAAADDSVPQPSRKPTSFDMQKLTMLAMIKIGLAKLKALKVLKFLAFLAVKLKMLLVWKLFMFVKLALAFKFFKLFVMPFLPNMLLWLKNSAMMQMSPSPPNMDMPMMPMSPSEMNMYRNDSNPESVHKRSTNFDVDRSAPSDRPNLIEFMFAVQTAKCVEKLACQVAGTKPLNINSVWMNWILSMLVSYIPVKNLKTYVSTFKDVSNYRLRNLYSNSSTEEWLKWCDKRYFCQEKIENFR